MIVPLVSQSFFFLAIAQECENLNFCGFHHIKKFDTNGRLIASWGGKGTRNGQFIHPHGIAVDSEKMYL
jgi:hypothetical protein